MAIINKSILLVLEADMASLFTKLHQNYNYNIEQLSLRTIRNWVEWKSENYKIKLNRNLTTTELKKPYPSRQVGGTQASNRLVPHPHVVDKISKGISQEWEDPAPHQGSSARKLSPQNFWLQKPVGTELVEETARAPSNSSHRTHTQIYSDSLALCSSTRVTTWEASVAYKEKQKYSASRWAETIATFLNPPPTDWQAGTIPETPSTWLTLFGPP